MFQKLVRGKFYKMKKKLKDDICMWISIIIIIFCIAIIRDNINKKNDYELNNKNKIVDEIRKSE